MYGDSCLSIGGQGKQLDFMSRNMAKVDIQEDLPALGVRLRRARLGWEWRRGLGRGLRICMETSAPGLPPPAPLLFCLCPLCSHLWVLRCEEILKGRGEGEGKREGGVDLFLSACFLL